MIFQAKTRVKCYKPTELKEELDVFAIHIRTVTGLEETLAQELISLDAKEIEIKNRLVICKGDQTLLYKSNLWCRTAIRVLKPLLAFSAPDEKSLYQGIQKIDWMQYLKPSSTLSIDADVRSSFTTHSLFISQLAKDAIVDQFREKTGKRPSVDLEFPDLRIVVSLFENHAQIYLDASGESLHKRGYRKKAGEAPISETLAAGILKLSKWDPIQPLLDPMCGSGTFLIEAALMATNTAPGLLRRHFGFQKWPDFDRPLWENLLEDAKKRIQQDRTLKLIGLDKDANVIEAAKENAERAGVKEFIQFEQGDFFEWDKVPDAPGMIVMNPPYDERLPVDNIADLYQRIGDHLKKHYAGWSANILAGNLDAAKYFGLRTSHRIPLFNGSIECRLLGYELRKIEIEGKSPRWREEEHTLTPKLAEKVGVFTNRLKKNFKHFSKWAKRENISCYRVYDWDIPELAFIVDLYGDRMHFAEIERNLDHSPVEHKRYIQSLMKNAAEVLGVESSKIYFKKRKPQKTGGFQYSAHDETGEFIEVSEGGHLFFVNLADYLDVGLFLDHRRTRALVEKEASGKDFLNLFAYTGSFTVYAAAGGAKSSVTVDTSNTYLDWAERNLKLNGIKGNHTFVRSDVLEFLDRTRLQFDLCVVDPPTRSVNRSSGREFDVQVDHVKLLTKVLARIRPGGRVYFSTNYRTFEFDEKALKMHHSIELQEITSKTIPLDFERKPSHRCWVIDKKG